MPRKAKGKGRAVKSARKKFGINYESDDIKLAPHTMVIKRGSIDNDIRDLISNMRQVMEPFTASSLKVTKKNSLKDFVSIAGPMHVSHLILMSQTELGDYVKFLRLPRGPTMHFRLIDFSTCNDVLNSLKKKLTHKKQFLHQPLLIINGFNSKDANGKNTNSMEPHHKLLTTSLQNMFPSINVTKVNLDMIRRCVLFNYNKEENTIDFRQYNIRLAPVGLSKPVKKLNQERLPDLSSYQDISEYMEKGGLLSESEMEDGPDNQVEIREGLRGTLSNSSCDATSAIRLSEIGPRMKLKLIKIEEGICDGEVLYHEFVTKTNEEVAKIREKLEIKKKAEKVKLKTATAKDKNNKDLKKKKDKKSRINLSKYANEKDVDYDESKENLEYYRKEMGEDPDEGFDRKRTSKRKRAEDYQEENELKRMKHETNGKEEAKNDFSVKFEKKGATKKPAKFFRLSNKKSSR